MADEKEEMRTFIRKRYAEVAQPDRAGGCQGGCCGGGARDLYGDSVLMGYSDGDLSAVPDAANMGLGCGNPVALASLQPGDVVLDMGCGGGLDCFLAAKRVGPTGRVIGVDMTPEMISLARRNAARSAADNVEFRLGEIEHLPVADETIDVILSNCVINLSQDKDQVFREAFRVLQRGGRLCVSDVVATAPLPCELREDPALTASCVGGAETAERIRALLESAGFSEIRMTEEENSREIIAAWVPGTGIEDLLSSVVIEAKK